MDQVSAAHMGRFRKGVCRTVELLRSSKAGCISIEWQDDDRQYLLHEAHCHHNRTQVPMTGDAWQSTLSTIYPA